MSLAALTSLVLFIGAEYLLHHAEPILRKRIIETLSARFDAPVELDRVDISLLKGIEVDGWGLRIPFGAGTLASAPSRPMIAVDHFAFQTSLRHLLHEPTRVSSIRVDGVALHIPRPDELAHIFGVKEGTELADPHDPRTKPRIALAVDEVDCRNVRLIVDPRDADQERRGPLQFDLASLILRHIGAGQPLAYDALLTIPKPRGLIHAVGHVSPWQESSLRVDPEKMPIDGGYTFTDADLGTIKGIAGTLASTGRFQGLLDAIAIDGETSTPDFSIDTANRPMPLETRFQAVVNGTTGDTYLQNVDARLGQSEFSTHGQVVRVKGRGHDIQLVVHIPQGRMQDFLRLSVKTTPPLMTGVIAMDARLHIPPGEERVAEKMGLQGNFRISGVRFSSARMQDRIDGLSVRAQGKPKEVADVSQDRKAEVHSELAANFVLGHGVMTVTDVRYQLPGALVLLNGVYSMDGRVFEFKGHVRTEATASQMVTGWKHWLLKPVDPFLRKNGAGLELPVEISGTEGDLHFGLAMHGTDETPKDMLSDVKAKERQRRGLTEAQREFAQADAEDAKAGKASSLEEAQRAHNTAVRLRAEAQARAQAVQKGSRHSDK